MTKLIDYLQQRMKIVVGVCYGLLTLIATFAAVVDKSVADDAVGLLEKFFPAQRVGVVNNKAGRIQVRAGREVVDY